MPPVNALIRPLVGLMLVLLVGSAQAVSLLKATSLVPCMTNSSLTATNFDVVFFPGNRTITYDISAQVEVDGKVSASVQLFAYGIKIIDETVDPCKENIKQLCPVSAGTIDINSNSVLSRSIVGDIPGVAFTVPDLDAQVYFRILNTTNNNMIACIRADFTNTKTVNHVGVKWATAVIAGFGLLTSAVVSTMGSSYTAAHIAANSVALFSYFQNTVIVCMEAVDRVPPIASAWAQNLAWSMGLIEVKFMQKIFRWYVQATGGTPTTYLIVSTISILVQRAHEVNTRVQDFVLSHARSLGMVKRSPSYGMDTVAHSSSSLMVLRGIKRVAYQAHIEQTSVVLTGFTFFVLICMAISIVFAAFRLFLMVAFKNRFVTYRANWRIMLKGTLLRILFIGLPQLVILSLWEFIERDSAAVIVLAVFFLILSAGILGWNSFKVWVIGRQSLEMYGTPAYMLFSDPQILNKYGFLYIQFDASKYYFIISLLVYTGVKAIFISFAQSSGKTQGLALFIIEAVYLGILSWKKPYMDKSTNVINIIIQSISTVNAFFFLFFSDLLTQPQAVSSIMGVIFFVLNAAFSLILLIYTLVTCTMVLLAKNPDARYKPAKDDRASFMQTHAVDDGDREFNNEFKALGDAARAGHEEGGVFTPKMNNDDFDPPSTIGTARDSYVSMDQPQNPFNEKRLSELGSVSGSTMEELTGPMRSGVGHSRDDSYTALNGDSSTNVNSEESKWKLPHLPFSKK